MYYTIKVVPDDAMEASVTISQDLICIDDILLTPIQLRKISNQIKLEDNIIWQNKCHLQQVDCEYRIPMSANLKPLMNEYGTPATANEILK